MIAFYVCEGCEQIEMQVKTVECTLLRDTLKIRNCGFVPHPFFALSNMCLQNSRDIRSLFDEVPFL